MVSPTRSKTPPRRSEPATPTFTPPTLVEAKDRSPKAEEYEEKAAGFLNYLMQSLASNEGTVADSAAFILHGPGFASKAGDLAAHDPRVAKAIDFISSGTDNPYAALAIASLPLVMQIIRNHESETARPLEVRVPFTKRTFKPRIRIRLKNRFLRSLTQAPGQLIERIFHNEEIAKQLMAQGVDVALPAYRGKNDNGNNGNGNGRVRS